MSAFDAHLSDITDAVFAEFGDADAVLNPATTADTVRADLQRATGEQALGRGSLVTLRSIVRIPFVDAPALKAKDELAIGGRLWRIVGAPNRPGGGDRWEAEVEELGPA